MSASVQAQQSVETAIAALTAEDRFPLFMLDTLSGSVLSGRNTRAMYERLRRLGIVDVVPDASDVYHLTPLGREVVDRFFSQE